MVGVDDSSWRVLRKEVLCWTVVVLGGVPGRCSLELLPQWGLTSVRPHYFNLIKILYQQILSTKIFNHPPQNVHSTRT